MKQLNIILALLVAITSTCTITTKAKSNELIIKDITLISAERKEPLEHASVRIRDGRIIEVSIAEINTDQRSQVIDGKGKYLIPGLMDSHVHLATMPGIAFGNNGPLEALIPLQGAFEKQQPRSYLYHGFTQLVDTAASPNSLQMFNQQPLKPVVFFCGATPIIGGYPTVFSNSDELSMRQFPYFIMQKAQGKKVSKSANLADHPPKKVI